MENSTRRRLLAGALLGAPALVACASRPDQGPLPEPWLHINGEKLSAIDKFASKYRAEAAVRTRFQALVGRLLNDAHEGRDIAEAIGKLTASVWAGANGMDIDLDVPYCGNVPHWPWPGPPPPWSCSPVEQYQVAVVALAKIQTLGLAQEKPA